MQIEVFQSVTCLVCLQDISFETACMKEKWFFDELFQCEKEPAHPDEDIEMRELCGINNMRAKLVKMYDEFMSVQIQESAPDVFDLVTEHGFDMADKWAWRADQENYQDNAMMMSSLKKMIFEVITCGKETCKPVSTDEILLRDDVRQSS